MERWLLGETLDQISLLSLFKRRNSLFRQLEFFSTSNFKITCTERAPIPHELSLSSPSPLSLFFESLTVDVRIDNIIKIVQVILPNLAKNDKAKHNNYPTVQSKQG
jgi:hypothetical protein